MLQQVVNRLLHLLKCNIAVALSILQLLDIIILYNPLLYVGHKVP